MPDSEAPITIELAFDQLRRLFRTERDAEIGAQLEAEVASCEVHGLDQAHDFAVAFLAWLRNSPGVESEDVAMLNRHQRGGVFHPYTCGTESEPYVARDRADGVVEWYCPACGHTEPIPDREIARVSVVAHLSPEATP